MSQAHILLVEDEQVVLSHLQEALSEAGFKVSSAQSFDAAFSMFNCSEVDLLITDIRMPDSVDGLTLARSMRRSRPQLPVIFLSGDLNGLANSDQVAAPSAFLVKPVVLNEMLDAVDKLMSSRGDQPDLIQSRAASHERDTDAQPLGTPTSDRHAVETAHLWEDEKQPGLSTQKVNLQ